MGPRPDRRVRSNTPQWRSGPPGGRRRENWFPCRCTGSGSPRRTGRTRFALLEEQARKSGAGPGPDPVRPDVGLAVHVLPWRRVSDGLRPGAARRAPTCRYSCAAMPTCPTSASLRRRTGGWCSASMTSTRRCPGPFEWDVKRLVASFEVAGRDQASTASSASRQPGHGQVLPQGDAGPGADEEARHLVLPPRVDEIDAS